MADKEVQVLDIAEQEAIGAAIVLMAQQSPFYKDTAIVTRYEALSGNTLGIFPQQGTVYIQRFVSGTFIAQYVFAMRYRCKPVSDARKLAEETRLEALARWLEKQTVTYKGKEYELSEWPELTGERRIQSVSRTSTVFAAAAANDGTIDYQVNMNLRYIKKEK